LVVTQKCFFSGPGGGYKVLTAQEIAILVDSYVFARRETGKLAAVSGLQIPFQGAAYPEECRTGGWELSYKLALTWGEDLGLPLIAQAAENSIISLCSSVSAAGEGTSCKLIAEDLTSRLPVIKGLVFSSAAQLLRTKAARQAGSQGAPLPPGLEEALWSQDSIFDESRAWMVEKWIQETRVRLQTSVDGARILSWAKSAVWGEVTR